MNYIIFYSDLGVRPVCLKNEHTFREQPRENVKKKQVKEGKKGQTDISNWFKTEDGRMVHKGNWMLTIYLRIFHPPFPMVKIKEMIPL
jgi:hypothetical protein